MDILTTCAFLGVIWPSLILLNLPAAAFGEDILLSYRNVNFGRFLTSFPQDLYIHPPNCASHQNASAEMQLA